MVDEQSNVIPDLPVTNTALPELRTEYFLADEEGFYKTTLHLTAEEAVRYTGLLAEKPPERESAGVVSIQLTPEEETERLWVRVRTQRAKLLAESDWVTARALDQGTPVPPEWVAYRQALRDITNQPDPRQLAWPALPA